MPYKRDTSELIRALEGHSVRGYPVVVPDFGKGTIVEQTPTWGAFTYYVVRFEKPVPFKKWIDRRRLSTDPLDRKEFEEAYEYGSRKPIIPVVLTERLEAGGKISMADVEEVGIVERGWMNEKREVTTYSFDVSTVFMEPGDVDSGMLVELVGANKSISDHNDVWAIRVSKVGGKEILGELLVPMTFLRMPSAIVLSGIKPGFHSKSVVAFGKGLAEAWEEKGLAFPPGEWSKDEQEYLLNEPLDHSVVEGFCKEHYPEDYDICWKQGILMYVLPASIDRKDEYHVLIRPLPEGLILVEYLELTPEEKGYE